MAQDFVVDNLEDLRAELMIWQSRAYLDLIRSAQGTSFETNAEALGRQMTVLNRQIKAGTHDMQSATRTFNLLIDNYNFLVDAIENYSGVGYYGKAVWQAVKEVPGKLLDLPGKFPSPEKILIYGIAIVGAGVALYALFTGAGKQLTKRILG